MSSREYMCIQCGEMRRAPIVYARPRDVEKVRQSAAWPKHCGEPMLCLTDEQGEAASHLDLQQRVKWLSKGLRVIQRHGKHSWVAAMSDYQVEESKRQTQAPALRSDNSKK